MDGIVVIGVPSSAGAHSMGLEKGPSHFRAAGLVDRLRAAGLNLLDDGDLPVARYQADKAQPRHRNLPAVVEVASRVADRLDSTLARAARPLVLGGDCTITIGAVAGAGRRVGALGLVYIDGHTDLNTPDTSRSGILDSMGLAHMIGLGSPDLSRLGSRFPLVDPEHVVAFGFHPDKIYPAEREIVDRGRMLVYPATRVAGRVAEEAESALATLASRIDAFLVHFDVDVIEFTDFPAADVPQYHGFGLSFEEALQAVACFASNAKFGGVVITEFNPDLDPDGQLVAKLTANVVDTLAGAQRSWR